jgi:hypothetical protein
MVQNLEISNLESKASNLDKVEELEMANHKLERADIKIDYLKSVLGEDQLKEYLEKFE